MKVSLWKLRAAVKGHGGKLLCSAGEYEALAPDGMCWSCDPTVHCLVASPWDDDTPNDLRVDMFQRVELGVEVCNCDDCKPKCPHGKPPEDCNACMVDSDHAFDADRESRFFR